MKSGDAEKLHKARELVGAWRDDDEELRIPMNDFGHELAQAIDVLLEATKPSGISIVITERRCMACGQMGHSCPTGGRLIGGGPGLGGPMGIHYG